jgi:PD-(D/E)XK nuclease family transposase
LNFALNDTPSYSLNTARKYIIKAKILDIETHTTVIEELNFAFIECAKFDKTLNKDSSKQDKWLYVLSHLANLGDMPADLSESLKLAFKERSLYNASLSYSRDLHNIEAQNYTKGKEEGKTEGEKKVKHEAKKKLLFKWFGF